MTYTESALAIEGITEIAIVDYFSAINRESFTEAASLFADAGEMLAPFEKPIVGRDEIAAYLTKEAKGMKLLPDRGLCEAHVDSIEYKITGKVKTSLFSVNVAWHFTLNSEHKITRVKIKLLASPQELLRLKSKRDGK